MAEQGGKKGRKKEEGGGGGGRREERKKDVSPGIEPRKTLTVSYPPGWCCTYTMNSG